MTDLETRIGKRFAALKAERRAGLVTFVTAGDPDLETSKEILFGLPGAGADLIVTYFAKDVARSLLGPTRDRK